MADQPGAVTAVTMAMVNAGWILLLHGARPPLVEGGLHRLSARQVMSSN
jgi:hypothetical protein